MLTIASATPLRHAYVFAILIAADADAVDFPYDATCCRCRRLTLMIDALMRRHCFTAAFTMLCHIFHAYVMFDAARHATRHNTFYALIIYCLRATRCRA